MDKMKLFRSVFLMMLGVCMCMLLENPMHVKAAPKATQMSKLTFDVDYYYNTYADLQSAIGYNQAALYKHYLQYGLKEGRSGSAEFNCKAYRNNYKDLQVAFGKDYKAYCLHYEQYGKKEGRNAVDQLATVTEPVETTGTTGAAGNVLGTYSTNYDVTESRATNVEVAASRINGVVLEPGQSFSFSKTVLPRTPQNGYVQGPVISGGRYVMGYGGGICQVSSTLYAAMLSANLPATERHPHSIPASYVPWGMDATISGNAKDLKFVNTLDKTIQISATTDAESGTLTVSIIEM